MPPTHTPTIRETVARREALRGELSVKPGPLPWLGRLGLGMALATLLCVLAVIVVRVPAFWGEQPGALLFPIWCVLYAGGLAWSWWKMRPRPRGRGSYDVLASCFLLQGLGYLLFWSALATSAWGLDRIWMDESPLDVLMEGVFLLVLAGPLVGSVLGFFAATFTLRGGWMCATQVLGLAILWLPLL